MKIIFLFVGKTKHQWIKDGIEDYFQRLKRFCSVEIITIKDEAKGEQAKIKKIETERILKIIKNNCFVCLLDLKGKNITSEEFAVKIKQWQERSVKELVFVIGGVYGVTAELISKSDYVLGFSQMTFTHETIRVILMEQVYRSFSIINGSKYHK